MAKLNIIICDLCQNMSKVELPFTLTLQSGKGKDKEITKAEICITCYNELYKRIELDFDLNNSLIPQPRSMEKIKIAEGESIVPSRTNTVIAAPKPQCYHDKTSYDPPNITCKDCGEEWKA